MVLMPEWFKNMNGKILTCRYPLAKELRGIKSLVLINPEIQQAIYWTLIQRLKLGEIFWATIRANITQITLSLSLNEISKNPAKSNRVL